MIMKDDVIPTKSIDLPEKKEETLKVPLNVPLQTLAQEWKYQNAILNTLLPRIKQAEENLKLFLEKKEKIKKTMEEIKVAFLELGGNSQELIEISSGASLIDEWEKIEKKGLTS